MFVIPSMTDKVNMAGWQPEFPRYTTIGSGHDTEKIKIDKLQPEQLEEAKAIFTTSVRTGPGVGLDEYTDAEIDNLFLKCVGSNHIGGWGAIVFTNDQSEIMALLLMYPSPLVRSSHSVYSGGYFAVNQKHQRKGLSKNQDYLLMSYVSPYSQGYIGTLGRQSILRKGMTGELWALEHKGMIPDSMKMARYGRVADIIVFTKDFQLNRAKNVKRKEMELKHLNLPPLNSQMYKSSLSSPFSLNCHTMNVKRNNPTGNMGLNLKEAQTAKDVLLVEELIRTSAERGDNFGMDEFDENGFFNRRLLCHSHVILAETPGGTAVGGAVFGPSRLTRSASTTTLAIYIVTSKAIADSDFNKQIVNIIMQWAASEKYDSILLDIYHTDYSLQNTANDMGFDVVGSIPHSGYLKGQGLTNCILYHRYLKHNSNRTTKFMQNLASNL